MPQFDKINFLSQIFWTLFFFLGFYFIILKNYLPLYGTVLKTRKKILNLEKQLSNTLVKTQKVTHFLSDLLVINTINTLRLILAKNYNSSCFWLGFQTKNVFIKKTTHWSYKFLNFIISPNLNLLIQKIFNKNFIK